MSTESATSLYELRPEFIGPGVTAKSVEDEIARPVESFPTFRWWCAFAVTSSLALLGVYCVAITVMRGIGMHWKLSRRPLPVSGMPMSRALSLSVI